jgi:FMN-dependent NADH-azoreductase
MRLLNIEASPRGAQSVSIALSTAFLEAFQASNPAVEIDTLNVWDADLPEFDRQAIGAKYKGVSKERMNDAEARVWESIQSLARRFQAADRILLGVPMWNFAYPYKLKHLIDLACQRDFLFTFDGKTYGPLVRADKAFAIFVRGQSEEAGFGALRSPGFEHQIRYLEFWLRFIGVREVASMTVEHTWDAQATDTVARGKAQAAAAAERF